jgi:hypothetical protein
MFKKAVVYIVSALLMFGGFTGHVSAGMITTEQALSLEAREARISQVQALIMQADVQQALVDLGVDPAQAALRAASLGDRELAQLQGQLETLPAGGSALALIGAVFLVLIILELTGVIDIFKKV